MAEDLLRRIQQQVDELMQELRGTAEERDRLRADLCELEAHPQPPVDLEPLDDPESCATIIPFPVSSERARTPAVSPKVTRLMRAPRRPGLERSGSGLMGGSAEEAAGANTRAS
jgi:hypothetical protein